MKIQWWKKVSISEFTSVCFQILSFYTTWLFSLIVALLLAWASTSLAKFVWVSKQRWEILLSVYCDQQHMSDQKAARLLCI